MASVGDSTVVEGLLSTTVAELTSSRFARWEHGYAPYLATLSVLVSGAVMIVSLGHPEWFIRLLLLTAGIAAFFFYGRPRARTVLVGVFMILPAVALFYRLADGSFYDWDEAIYAEVAREMIRSRDWITPTLGGVAYWHKPPLYIWLTGLVYQVNGVNEFSARFSSAIFGIGVVILTCALGWRMFSWASGVAAALLLVSVNHGVESHWYNFVSQARVGMVETTLTFWILLSLLLTWEARRRPRLIVLTGLCTGLAVMTKSWPGLFAFAVPVLATVLTRSWNAARRFWWHSALLAALIIVPWHLSQVWRFGTAFLHDYVVVNLLGRMVGLVEQQPRGVFFYLDVMRDGLPLFCYLAPLAAVWFFWSIWRRRDPAKIVVLSSIALPLIVFSSAHTKLGWYIIVIYPAVALLLAQAGVEWLGGRITVTLVAVAMALFWFRLPVPTNGSPGIQQFAADIDKIVPKGEIVSVYLDISCDGSGNLTEYSHHGTERIHPTMLYYLDRPLRCVNQLPDRLAPNEKRSFLVLDTRIVDPRITVSPVLVRNGSFVLTR